MDSIKRLTELFNKFPTVGQRAAGRFVMYLVNQPKEQVDELVAALQALKNNIKLCAFCFQPYEALAKEGLCQICLDPSRNKQMLCIVEKESDLNSIENTKRYKGLYFILGGVATFRKNTGEHLRIKELQDRVNKNSFSEIIVALNPTPEGKSTSVLVERALKELQPLLIRENKQSPKITHLAQGLPVGGELEYADEETLESAFEGRK